MRDQFGLTARELELVIAVCEGRTYEGAALHIGLKVSTARDYMKAIRRKMGVYGLAAMGAKAERAGLLRGIRL